MLSLFVCLLTSCGLQTLSRMEEMGTRNSKLVIIAKVVRDQFF